MQLTHLLLLLAIIPSIATLECYVCNSLENPNCADASALESFRKLCPQQNKNETFCRKIDQTINGEKSVVRSCGLKKGNKDCYKTAGSNSANVCSCNQDLCNTATSFNRQQQALAVVSSAVAVTVSMLLLR